MKIVQRLEDLADRTKPAIVAVGSFDGVHRGHQEVIRRARVLGAETGGAAWVLTFDPHPMKVLRPRQAPRLLTSTAHKLALLRALQVDGCLLLPFTVATAGLKPENFLEGLRARWPDLRGFVVGSNWTFGHRGRGNAALLRRWAAGVSLDVTVVEPVIWNGEPVSSTRIRRAVEQGRLEEAAAMLGRPFSILGTVVTGRGVGAELGFPTANLDPHNEVRPPSGIYAAEVIIDGQSRIGAAFLGEPAAEIVEVYLLDFQGDLYGRELEVFFRKRLRDVRQFPSKEDLRAQIARDVEQVRREMEGASEGGWRPA